MVGSVVLAAAAGVVGNGVVVAAAAVMVAAVSLSVAAVGEVLGVGSIKVHVLQLQ